MSVVYLTSVVNFRDFGGHPTISGQNVARGRLYRSNQFSRLNADDAAKLAALGIAAVVDLRSAAERTAQPTAHSVGRGPDHVSARADTDFIFTDIFASTEPTEGAWLDAFKRFYGASIRWYKAVFIGHLMKSHRVEGGEIRLGAGVTYSEATPLIREHIPAAYDCSMPGCQRQGFATPVAMTCMGFC